MSLENLTPAQLNDLVTFADGGTDALVQLRKSVKNKATLKDQLNEFSGSTSSELQADEQSSLLAKFLQLTNNFWGTFNAPFSVYWGLTEFTITAAIAATAVFAGVAIGVSTLLGIIAACLYCYKMHRDEKKAAQESLLQAIKLNCLKKKNEKIRTNLDSYIQTFSSLFPNKISLAQLIPHTMPLQNSPDIPAQTTKSGKKYFSPRFRIVLRDNVWDPITAAIDAFGTAFDNTWGLISIGALLGFLGASLAAGGTILILTIVGGTLLAIGMIVTSRIELRKERVRKTQQEKIQTAIEAEKRKSETLIQQEKAILTQIIQNNNSSLPPSTNNKLNEPAPITDQALSNEQTRAIRFTTLEKITQFFSYFASGFTTTFSVFWELASLGASSATASTVIMLSIGFSATLLFGVLIGGLYLYKMGREEEKAIDIQEQLNRKLAAERNRTAEIQGNVQALQALKDSIAFETSTVELKTQQPSIFEFLQQQSNGTNQTPPASHGSLYRFFRTLAKRIIDDKVWGPITIGLAVFGVGFGTAWGIGSLATQIGLLGAAVGIGGAALLFSVVMGLVLGIAIGVLHYLSLDKEEQRETEKNKTMTAIANEYQTQKRLARAEILFLYTLASQPKNNAPPPACDTQLTTKLFLQHLTTTLAHSRNEGPAVVVANQDISLPNILLPICAI